MKVFELMNLLGMMPAGAEVWMEMQPNADGEVVALDAVEEDGDGEVRLKGVEE